MSLQIIKHMQRQEAKSRDCEVYGSALQFSAVPVLGSCPSGSRNTQGMIGVGEEEDRHTQKVA